MDLENSTSVWDYRIRKMFANTEKNDNPSGLLWKIVNIVLYENTRDTTLMEIYKTLDKDNFIRLIQLLDGRSFRAPTRSELEEALLTAIFYYEKEVNDKNWQQIQNEIDFEISPRKYGIRVRNLNNYVVQKIQELLRDIQGGDLGGRSE